MLSDVAVKQILLAKNQQQHFIIEDLDDYHLLIKVEEEDRIRRMLDTEVPAFTFLQALLKVSLAREEHIQS